MGAGNGLGAPICDLVVEPQRSMVVIPPSNISIVGRATGAALLTMQKPFDAAYDPEVWTADLAVIWTVCRGATDTLMFTFAEEIARDWRFTAASTALPAPA